MDSKESVVMADDNMGPSTVVAVKTLRKPLFPIPEAEASSRAPTPTGFDGASGSKRP
jgi:hypothetical protein